jgi:ubiquinone/menaquinone biosynthesis C-methylase UbiE
MAWSEDVEERKKAAGNNINWLDMGCGDGRCLEVLDDIQDRGNIYYHGIDISHKFLDEKIGEFERGERCGSI